MPSNVKLGHLVEKMRSSSEKQTSAKRNRPVMCVTSWTLFSMLSYKNAKNGNSAGKTYCSTEIAINALMSSLSKPNATCRTNSLTLLLVSVSLGRHAILIVSLIFKQTHASRFPAQLSIAMTETTSTTSLTKSAKHGRYAQRMEQGSTHLSTSA